MDGFGAVFSLVVFIIIIYLISRVAHHFKDTKQKLAEINQKIDEIQKEIAKGK